MTFDEQHTKDLLEMFKGLGAKPCLFQRAGENDVQTYTIISSEFKTAPDGKTLGKVGGRNLIASLMCEDVRLPKNGDMIVTTDKHFQVVDTSVTYRVHSVQFSDDFQTDVVVTKC